MHAPFDQLKKNWNIRPSLHDMEISRKFCFRLVNLVSVAELHNFEWASKNIFEN